MILVGIDEVGRGCWAGPVVAAAVILKDPIDGLRDSKQLSKRRRQLLAQHIREQALAIGIGWIEPAVLDQIGLTEAVGLAMRQALAEIELEYDAVIIDGQYNFLANNPKTKAVVKADSSVPAVSAASIIAKVARDDYMCELAASYPGYGFETHVGYGTALHRERLKLLGISDQHRQSFKPIRALV